MHDHQPEWSELRAAALVHEDDHVLVLDKPAGISVTGERHGVDLVKLAGQAGERLYPVNRIDKLTSGLVLIAKTLSSHGPLTRQFAARTVNKKYFGVVDATTKVPDKFKIDLPLRTAASGRVRVAAKRADIAFDQGRGCYYAEPLDDYPSLSSQTNCAVVDRGQSSTLVAVFPITGRRHQIRVHLAWIGFPLVGDPLFKPTNAHKHRRLGLHAFALELALPWSGEPLCRFEAPIPSEFLSLHPSESTAAELTDTVYSASCDD